MINKKIASKVAALAGVLFVGNICSAQSVYNLSHRNDGVAYDCSDCDRKGIAKQQHLFTPIKSKSAVVVDVFENGKRVKSSTFVQCIISDQLNWLCYTPIKNNEDDYDETIIHKMERGFYEFKASSRHGRARYCGSRSSK